MEPLSDSGAWIFGYGSLMWRPGFAYRAVRPALLRGYHRAFCVHSVHHRGTPERPGLVLGLDRGGACLGRAYRVADDDLAAVLDYLDARERVTHVYLRRRLPIHVDGRRVAAFTYVVDRDHARYAGKLAPREIAEIILGGHGQSGDNCEYLASTVAHLDELGIADGPLHAVLDLVAARPESRGRLISSTRPAR